MKLYPLGNNKTQVTLNNGTAILFSYMTPVAACLSNGGGFIYTSHKWSKTTTKHISQWMGTNKMAIAAEKPQEYFDNLVKG
jgi:hypothetical protein